MTGLLGEDTINYTLSRDAGEHVEEGGYVITPEGDAEQGNYAVTYVSGILTITPAAATVTAADKTKIYGKADPALTASVTGLKNRDAESVISYTLSRETGEDVKHIPASKLIQTKTGKAVNTDIHPAKSADELHSDGTAVLIADFFHQPEQRVLVGVPVYLPIIDDTKGSKVVNKLGDHLNFLFNLFVIIVVPNGGNNEHGLVIQITICVIENFLISKKFSSTFLFTILLPTLAPIELQMTSIIPYNAL